MKKYISLALYALGLSLLFTQISAQACEKHSLNVKNVWAKPTLGERNISAIYMEIENNTEETEYLESVECDKAESTELHKTVTEKDVSSMIAISKLAIPSKKTVEMKPGGIHIMLMGLKEKLNVGDEFTIKLHFANKGTVEQKVNVRTLSGEENKAKSCH